MHELSGKIKDFLIDFKTGKATVTFTLNEKNNALIMYNKLLNVDKLSINVDKYREKRSLDANNYAWLLIGKIGDELRLNKEAVYLEMLKRYGKCDILKVFAEVPIYDYVKYYEEEGESSANGKLYKYYKVYKGSSKFDTREMSIFIDGIVSEAKELGIPTETPEQIAKIKSLWTVD